MCLKEVRNADLNLLNWTRIGSTHTHTHTHTHTDKNINNTQN